MNKYEAMFIFKPDISKEAVDGTVNQIKDAIAKNKGSLSGEIKEIGKQKLAYPIKKHKEGIYSLVNFNIDPSAISNLKRVFTLTESILRVLIVKI